MDFYIAEAPAPEPSSLCLLALGAATLVQRRK
ncbi:MAG: PEP-CTERM sorting domain-containing protein [Phycisphaerae bacterium]